MMKQLTETYTLADCSELHLMENGVSTIHNSIMALTLSRRLIITGSCVGLGPTSTVAGDKLQFVLRRRYHGGQNEFESLVIAMSRT